VFSERRESIEENWEKYILRAKNKIQYLRTRGLQGLRENTLFGGVEGFEENTFRKDSARGGAGKSIV